MRRARLARQAALAAAVAAAGAVGVGCGGEGEGSAGAGPQDDSPPTVERNRIEVVAEQGNGGFDASTIYDRLAPGVVTVVSVFEGGAPTLGGDGSGGLGSGFILDGEGHVATNAHVVSTGRGTDLDSASEVYVEFGDGNRVAAEVLGTDPFSDVALLKIDPAGLDLTPLELGSSSEGLTVGEPVAAIGSPFGERQSLSVGVISALDRDIQSLTRFQIGDAIQTDAAINQGNSGGPLLDSEGRVLGINAQIRSTSGGGVGVGFAIPVDTVARSIDQLRENGEVSYAFLGISSLELYPQLADHLGIDAESGALVADVVPGSPADEAGIEAGDETTEFQGQQDVPEGGDAIVAVEGEPIDRDSTLADLVENRAPGSEVELTVLRGGERRDVTVELVERDSAEASG